MTYIPNRIALRVAYVEHRIAQADTRNYAELMDIRREAVADFDNGVSQIQYDAILHAADRMLEVAERQPVSLDVESAKVFRAVLREIAKLLKHEA